MCDGIVMGHRGMHYSLASRELIADSVETVVAAHCFDGVVLVPNCDKIVPGMLMAALRMNIPAIVCSGGPMLAGHVNGRKTSLSQMFEAVGAYKAGTIDEEGLACWERGACPSCGSCSGMFTRELDELPERSAWAGPARQRQHTRAVLRTHTVCQAQAA